MPVHDAIPEVEPLEIGHSSGFHIFRQIKALPDQGRLSEILSQQQQLILHREIRRLRGWILGFMPEGYLGLLIMQSV
jgi:hypothetical protein